MRKSNVEGNEIKKSQHMFTRWQKKVCIYKKAAHNLKNSKKEVIGNVPEARSCVV